MCCFSIGVNPCVIDKSGPYSQLSLASLDAVATLQLNL